MAWTTPRTWVTGETVTAAIMNAHVRDNFLETSTATASAAGDIVYADGNKSMGSRLAIAATRSFLMSNGSAPVWKTIDTDSSGNSDDLSTANLGTGWIPMGSLDGGLLPDIAVTVTVTGSSAMVGYGAWVESSVAGKLISVGVDISGAHTLAPTGSISLAYEAAATGDRHSFGRVQIIGGITAGSSTFQMRVKSEATNVATFRFPYLWVWPF